MIDSLGLTKDPVLTLPGRVVGSKVERARHTYCEGEHELLLSIRDVTDAKVKAVSDGEAEFALVVEDPVILLCSRFGQALPWTAAPYCWHESPRQTRSLPPPEGSPGESRALLHVQLVDAATGLVRASRNVTFWLHFTRALHEAIRDQARVPFDPRAHERTMARLRQRYPTDEALAASSTVRTFGCL